MHAAISEITEKYRGGASTHYSGAWRGDFERTNLFSGVAELTVPFVQHLDADGLVDRVASISFVAAAPEHERDQILAHVRELAGAHPPPLALGHTTQVSVFERR